MMASCCLRLDSLGPEILALILEFVNDTSPRTLRSVGLTNKYLNSATNLIKGRYLTFHLTKWQELPTQIKPLLQDRQLLGNIRSITIEGRPEHNLPFIVGDTYRNAYYDDFVLLITQIGRLRILKWNITTTIPLEILEALEAYQKQASLRVFNWEPPTIRRLEPDIIAFSKSSTLTHLRAVIKSIRGGVGSDPRQQHIRTVVAGAPKLEYIGIVNYVADASATQPGSITLDTTDLHDKPNSSVRMLTLDGFNMDEQTLKDWSNVVDLSSLHNVKVSRGKLDISYFQSAINMLPNLKEISLNFGHVHSVPGGERSQLAAAARDYLTTCSPVESLSLWSWRNIITLNEILKQHGATMRSLQLHEKECASNRCPNQGLSYEELNAILDKCTSLTSLTVDLRRTTPNVKLDKDDDNMKYFEALSRVSSRLSTLQIYFDAGLLYLAEHPSWIQHHYGQGLDDQDEDNDPEPDIPDDEPINHNTRNPSTQGTEPTSPRLMQAYVGDIWRVIYGSHTAGSRTLIVKAGEWESACAGMRQDQTRMIFNPENLLVRQFIAKPNERDDEVNQCLVKVLMVGLDGCVIQGM